MGKALGAIWRVVVDIVGLPAVVTSALFGVVAGAWAMVLGMNALQIALATLFGLAAVLVLAGAWRYYAAAPEQRTTKQAMASAVADSSKATLETAKLGAGLLDLVNELKGEADKLRRQVAAGDETKRSLLVAAESWEAHARQLHSAFGRLAIKYVRQHGSATYDLTGLNLVQAVLFGPTAPLWQMIPANDARIKLRPAADAPESDRLRFALHLIEALHGGRSSFVDELEKDMQGDISELFTEPFKLPLQLAKPLGPSTEVPPSQEGGS